MSDAQDRTDARTMRIGGRTVTVFPAAAENAPLVLCHTVRDEGRQVHSAVNGLTRSPFSFATIGNLAWDDDMTPWPIPPISTDDSPCAGLADEHIGRLTEKILPGVLATLGAEPSYVALAGYSLAGLFAVYALYRTDVFDRVASASGSFWYPDFLSFATSHEPLRRPDRIYFSLGDQEDRTGNAIVRPVRVNTARLCEWYREQGVTTTFELNPGHHFEHGVERMAKGIAWLLDD